MRPSRPGARGNRRSGPSGQRLGGHWQPRRHRSLPHLAYLRLPEEGERGRAEPAQASSRRPTGAIHRAARPGFLEAGI